MEKCMVPGCYGLGDWMDFGQASREGHRLGFTWAYCGSCKERGYEVALGNHIDKLLERRKRLLAARQEMESK